MAKDKTTPTAEDKGVTTEPAVTLPERYISTDFTLRSRRYLAGEPLDNLAEHDLCELILAGHAAPAIIDPAPGATTEEQS